MDTLGNIITEEKATQQIEKAITTDQNAVPYIPMSKLPTLGTVVPLNLAGETLEAQFAFTEEVPDIDQFLVDKLGYTSKLKLSEYLAAEQADAVAMAIRQIEKDKGFILADMTGTGKGRICAAIIRYAFVNDYLPIFITERDNLFSAIYRDLVDIGGVETKPAGKPNLGLPFILNGFKSGGYEKGFDEDGNPVKIKKPSQTGIVNAEGKEVITALPNKEVAQIVSGDSFPKGYDYMMLTYSQIAGEKTGKQKLEYILRVIEKKKGKVILVADESHNAVGTKSSVGRAMTEIVQSVKGCLFSSATFSKRPDNMYIYSMKTDVSTSPLGTSKLIQVIKAGGERLIENLASNLVLAQQMVRRQKTYDNCTVLYNYMDESNKKELFDKYDATIKEYRELQRFCSEDAFKDAYKTAIFRFATENKVEFIDELPPALEDELKKWQAKNKGKYYLKEFTAGEIKRNQFQFIETLLFALKADFVADQAIEQLKTKSLNLTVLNKEEFYSNRKPVIAVRNTVEGIYYSLGLKVNDTIDKADFSKYIYSLALDAMTGTVKLKRIDVEGKGKGDEKKKKKSEDIIDGELQIKESDFPDKGEKYRNILKRFQDINLNIPLSPIDHIINKIQSTKRADWDKYGIGEYFKVGEVTGRKFSLVPVHENPKDKTSKIIEYKLELNPKAKNKSTTFKDFNNGYYDVLLINESGSTGEDAHSAAKFKDTRPRVMIIHQVELDVSTEVQKRGRIHRTGMVNYPTYVYAVSRIPSEIRRLLMLVRKLRTLDANTTANQKQSAKLSTIKDSFDNEIEDVINKYGDECLEEFIQSNDKYEEYMPTDAQKNLGSLSGGFVIESFVRNLELALSEEQEYFYNTVNALYLQLKEKLGSDYDLETNIVDLKADIKTRVVIDKGINTNPFTTSVYEEEDYVLAEDKPYSAEKVEELVLSLSNGKDPDEFFMEFLDDFDKHFREVHLKDVEESIQKPDFKGIKSQEEKDKLQAEYELKVKAAKQRAIDEHSQILSVFYAEVVDGKDGIPVGVKGRGGVSDTGLNFKPRTPVLIPAVIEECYEKDDAGLPMVPKELNNGKFCGIKILKTAKEKYSPMNIELIFCQLSGKPKVIFKPTLKGREVLYWVVVKSKSIISPRLKLIESWETDPNARTLMRLFTGNILGAYGIAKDRVSRNAAEYSPVIQFVKFTTVDETIRLGVKVTLRKYVPLLPQNVPVVYQLSSPTLLEDLMNIKQGFKVSTNSDQNFRIRYNPRNSNIYVEIFGGKPTSAGKDPMKVDYYCINKKSGHDVYNDGELRKMMSQFAGVYSPISYRPIGNVRDVTLRAVGFNTTLTPETIGKVKEIFGYIYSKYPFNVDVSGIESEETIYNRGDIRFKPEGETKEIESEEGEYAYETTRPYESIKKDLEGYNKFLRYERTSDFGTVYLKKKASIIEAVFYGLVPLDNSIVDMVTQSFQSIPNDAEKIKLTEDVEKAIKEQKSVTEIGRLVYNAIGKRLVSIKVIFGPEADDIDFIGDVFIRYAKGEIKLPEVEKKEEKKQPTERPKKPLDLETAQEYMWLLSYKVKNV